MLYGYGKTHIPLLGQFKSRVKTKSGIYKSVMIRVTKGKCGNLLDYKTSVELGIVNKIENVKVGGKEKPRQDSWLKFWKNKFKNLFSGKTGKLKDHMVELHIDESVTPEQEKLRHVPFHQRDAVEREIKRMLDEDIIEPVDGPTPWISPIVIVPKSTPGEIRICTDARKSNRAIKRQRHITPTVNDLRHKLNGAAVISKFDLRSGYNQLVIHPKSRYITAFCTHMGVFQYKRLNFGINTAAEIFQKTIENVLSGLTGVINMSDDIIVFGKNQAEHDKRLRSVLERLEQNGLTLNEKKCEFNKEELDFFGLHFSKGGISVEDTKVKALKEAPAPKNPSELRSFLGLANYCSCFIPNLATLAKPLRKLTNKKTRWEWTDEHEKAMDEIKSSLVTSSIAYFNKDMRSEITVDASPVGLGLVFAQYDPKDPNKKRIVQFDSRTLSDVETRYSQVEKEALAVVWACEKLHLYLYGSEFDIVTDNKAVELIFGNPKSKPKARIERWCLRLLPYSFVVKHRPGDGNIADYLSRIPIMDKDDLFKHHIHAEIAERYVNSITKYCLPKAISKKELIRETNDDPLLQQVKLMVYGKRYQQSIAMKSFERSKADLIVTKDGIVMRGGRVVIPKSLQSDVIKLAHSGHQGIDKTKRLLRSFVWFDGIDDQVETMVKKCKKCQINTKQQKFEPLRMTPMPGGPWEHLSLDYYGPLKNGKYLLVIVDDHSRYPLVKLVSSTSFKALKPVLDDTLATFGIPKQMRSDNGPPFNGHEFKQYSEALGFEHKRITPLWPKANGMCERFMKNLGKVMRNASVDESSWEAELLEFLRSYRATPHSTTGVAPNELMFKTKSSTTKLPNGKNNRSTDDSVETRARIFDSKRKEKMKAYADKKARAKESKIKVGDIVLLAREPKCGKSKTENHKEEFEVIKINGTQAIIKSDEATFKRNTSALKVIGHIKPKTKPETDRSSFIQVRSTNPQSPVTQVGTGLDGPDLIDLMVVDPPFTDAVNQMRGSILDDINKRKSAHVDIELSLNELFDDEMHEASSEEEFDSAESEANASENEEEPGENRALMVNERDQDGIFQARRSTRTKKPVEPFGHVVSSDQRKYKARQTS